MPGKQDKATRTVPVHVIGGFLGSGKTTLLTRLLEWSVAGGARPGVVENEFGEDVDGTVLHSEHQDEPVEIRGLAGGCVCCDLTHELGKAVQELAGARGRSPVFVEATGLASLPRVVEALAVAAAETGAFRLGTVIGVVDSARLSEVVRTWDAAEEHLRGTDWVVLNQTDRASPAQLEAARTLVARLAPGAKTLETSWAQVDPARLLDDAPRPRPLRLRLPSRDTTDGFSNCGFKLTRPLDLEKLAALARCYPRTLVRLKGIVQAGPDCAWHEIQWHPGAFTARPWTGTVEDSYLVAIGRRLNWERFLDGVGDCLVRRRARARQ